MSWATWTGDARRLAEVDRAHRQAKQSKIVGRQLVPVGKVAKFMSVCFAIGIGSLMLMPVDKDVPENIVAITAMVFVFFAPFSTVWLKLSDFERLHAPPAGLLLLRLRRLSPYLLLIGAVWGLMLWNGGGNVANIAAIAVMPFAMSFTHMLRFETAGFVLRALIAVTFVLSWVNLVPWLSIGTLALAATVAVWFVRDLGIYDREGFALDNATVNHLADVRAQIAAERELPDVRKTPRRSLFGNARFLSFAAQRDLPALWQRQPLPVTLSNLLVAAVWLTPVWLAIAAVWQSSEHVAAVWCLVSAIASAALFTIEPNEQLYLWGTDMRQIERQNVLARLMTVAVPTVLAAAIATAMFDDGGARWTAVLLLGGTHLARIGIVAFNGLTRMLIAVAVVTLLVIGGGNSVDANTAHIAALALIAFGVLGAVLRLFRDEDALRENVFDMADLTRRVQRS